MKEPDQTKLLQLFDATTVQEIEVIQTLWSGYGKITRLGLEGGDVATVITKNIVLPSQQNHPRGWNTNASHLRKIKSYQVEVEWYKNWAFRCNATSRVPLCYQTITNGKEHTIILEDLDAAGYPIRKSNLDKNSVKIGLEWLANFHATFLNEKPNNLWQQGSYWHLSTRLDELVAMKNGQLKQAAYQLDELLTNCQFQTLVHGDAKVANFCFAKDLKKVSVVDFQYVGGGCGMKDVAYFLGSCLNEAACEKLETELLDHYFSALKTAIEKKHNNIVQFNELEKEWRRMFPIAWADFTRFLLGWMPTHQKINNYSHKLINQAIGLL